MEKLWLDWALLGASTISGIATSKSPLRSNAATSTTCSFRPLREESANSLFNASRSDGGVHALALSKHFFASTSSLFIRWREPRLIQDMTLSGASSVARFARRPPPVFYPSCQARHQAGTMSRYSEGHSRLRARESDGLLKVLSLIGNDFEIVPRSASRRIDLN